MSSLSEAVKNNYEVLKKLGSHSSDIIIKEELYYKNKVVGYTILNDGTDAIHNISVPNYVSGKIEKIKLNQRQSLTLPTKWLVFLLFRPEFCLSTKFEDFVATKKTVSDNIDDICKNYKINKHNRITPTINIEDKKGKIKKEYKSRFLYLENKDGDESINFLKLVTKDDGKIKCLIKP